MAEISEHDAKLGARYRDVSNRQDPKSSATGEFVRIAHLAEGCILEWGSQTPAHGIGGAWSPGLDGSAVRQTA
jgi:hypothetical protein